jgi:hypothetical protein
MSYNPRTEEAYKLLHDGALALVRAEQQGMRVDMNYANNKKQELTDEIAKREQAFKNTKFYRHWEHVMGEKVNINSNFQLSNFLYKIKKVEIEFETPTGRGATNEEALEHMNIPELNDLLDIRKLKKVRDTYLDAFIREQVNGYVHPFFNLHLVRTFRSCIAKGTSVLVVRNFLDSPKGIPIEDVQAGDYIYCFDDNLQPAIGKVSWTGKTGHREVIRVHYSVRGSDKGYVDVTPEHKIRLIDGTYEQAQNLIGDFRNVADDRHIPKIRVLSCKRYKDQLRFTGHNVLEHRLVYSKLVGTLQEEDLVHHKNEIHLDHTPTNLEKMSHSKHSAIHCKDTIRSIEGIKKNRIAIQKAVAAGVYKQSALCGEFKPNNHVITKIEWIKKTVDVYDIDVEGYHNFFANEICVHNSSDHPNLQNIPKRDVEAMQLCRKALFPRPGHQLLEVDFGQLEVRIAACYHKDPTMIKYIEDPSTDMHRDMCEQIFKIKFDKTIEGHSILRSATKNGFVFPEFYGDYYKNCAAGLACSWGKLPQGKWSADQGIKLGNSFLSNHLISKGFKELGESGKVGDRWITTGFMRHIKDIEFDFWNNRFPDYAAWKERWWKIYQKYGYIDMFTGFRCSGSMSKNDAINYPVQGAAFHCLLWSFIQMDQMIIREKLDTRLVGQIHDSMLLDVHPDELNHVMRKVRRITCRDLPEAWPWIIVPLDVDMELSPVDCSWADKKEVKK